MSVYQHCEGGKLFSDSLYVSLGWRNNKEVDKLRLKLIARYAWGDTATDGGGFRLWFWLLISLEAQQSRSGAVSRASIEMQSNISLKLASLAVQKLKRLFCSFFLKLQSSKEVWTNRMRHDNEAELASDVSTEISSLDCASSHFNCQHSELIEKGCDVDGTRQNQFWRAWNLIKAIRCTTCSWAWEMRVNFFMNFLHIQQNWCCHAMSKRKKVAHCRVCVCVCDLIQSLWRNTL